MSTPALIVRGSCDYLSWSSAVDYCRTLSDSQLVYVPGAGHSAFAERPDAFFPEAAAFLAGQSLPSGPLTTAAEPAG